MSHLIGAVLLCAAQMASAQRGPRIRDSAGVRIVENGMTRTSGAAFMVATSAIAEAGGLRDIAAEEIESRTGFELAVRLSNGGFAAAEMTAVRIVDAAGRFVRTVGRAGGGPGEFGGQINFLCLLHADTLLVGDFSRRVSVFDPLGRYVRSVSADRPPVGRGCTAAGEVLATEPVGGSGGVPVRQDGAVAQQYARVLLLSPRGAVADTIAVLPAAIGTYPYRVILDGLRVAIHDKLVYAGNGSSNEIRVFTTSGRLVQIIRWADELVPVTAAMIADVIAWRMQDESAAQRAAAQADARMLRHRPFLPSYDALHVDRTGRLWVRDYTLPTRRALPFHPSWTLFRADGVLLGRFDVPTMGDAARIGVTDVGADFVVLRASGGSEGVQLRAYRITPYR